MLNIFFTTFITRVTAQWKITIAVLLLLPLLTKLGFWQLERAKQKNQWLEFYTQQSRQAAIPLRSLTPNSQTKYQNVTLTGKYDSRHYWLLDNQPRAGKVGYEIIMPFNYIDQSGVKKIQLINRGWLKANADRNRLPLINTPEKCVTIRGHLYPLPVNAIIKHSHNDLNSQWPKRVLQLDNKAASTALNKNINTLMLRIDEDNIGAFVTQWPLINIQAEKHYGYAVQWFVMSIALLLLYFWVLFKSNKPE